MVDYAAELQAVGDYRLPITVYRLPINEDENYAAEQRSCGRLAVNNFVVELWLHLSIIQTSLILRSVCTNLGY